MAKHQNYKIQVRSTTNKQAISINCTKTLDLNKKKPRTKVPNQK